MSLLSRRNCLDPCVPTFNRSFRLFLLAVQSRMAQDIGGETVDEKRVRRRQRRK